MFFGSVYTTPASPLIRVLKCPVNTAVALNVLVMLAPAAIGFPALAKYIPEKFEKPIAIAIVSGSNKYLQVRKLFFY